MDLTRTDDQVELATLVARVLEERADSRATRVAMESPDGHDVALRQTLCEQVGVAALPIPEELGGAGFGLAESFVVLEEVARSLAPTPLLATLAATEALLAADGGVAAELLPRIAAGEVATLVPDRRADVIGDVAYGDVADIVLAVRDGALVLLDSPATSRTPAMDPTLRLATVDVSGPGVVVVEDATEALRRARLVEVTGTALLGVGVMQRGLDMTVAHCRERVQFGRPIGSFQALKHRMADLLVLVEMARSAAWAASYAVSRGSHDAARHATVAAAYVGEAAPRLAGEVVQLHGGIAITWEHDAHLVFKRAHAVAQLTGQPHEHRAALA